jgi:hypothetical protein
MTLLELDGVKPPHGATASLLMLSPRGGGVLTMKCAEASGVKRMPNNDTSLNVAIMTAKKTLGW